MSSLPTAPAPGNKHTGGSVTRMRTPRRRSEDQRVNLRRSYQAFLRNMRAGNTTSSTYQSWPIRPYAASI